MGCPVPPSRVMENLGLTSAFHQFQHASEATVDEPLALNQNIRVVATTT
jgi:hypothetical protein